MTPEMPRQQDRTKFPGMRPHEAALMRAWLRLHESEYDAISYNVRVGAPRDPGEAFPEWVRKSARDSSQLRMDAEAVKAGSATIIELKNYATADAVKQITMYAVAWVRDHAGAPQPRLLVVCAGAAQEALQAAHAAGVEIEVVIYGAT